jgi:hypothetical protein
MRGAILAATGEELTDTRVRHFQATRGLKVDGDIGEQTRRALITEYMAADGSTLPASIDPLIHGCGENFPLESESGQPNHAHDRRVELFFFDGDLGILPPPPGELSPPGSTEYPEWRRRSIETHDFTIRDPDPNVLDWVVIELVHASDRSPVEGRSVRVRLRSSLELVQTTGEDGRVTFLEVPPGETVDAEVLAEPVADTTLEDPPDIFEDDDLPVTDEPEAEAEEEPPPEEEFETAEDEDAVVEPLDESDPPPELEQDLPDDDLEVDDDDLPDD